MLQSMLPIKNFYWANDSFQPSVQDGNGAGWLTMLAALRGQFALASSNQRGDKITLVRDPLGVNKLFFAVHPSGRVSTSNYLIDLVNRCVPCENIYSVPAGHVVEIDVRHQHLVLARYVTPRANDGGAQRPVEEMARTIRENLEVWFARLARQFRSRKVIVTLSGGLDSGLIAAFAKRYFGNVTAYTYSYAQPAGLVSDDARFARQLADHLEIPFRFVPASAEAVLEAVEPAVVNGQDWRDFNVHCAIVNELLSQAIRQDLAERQRDRPVLVLTGDLMNEFMADYTPSVYGNRTYYALPRLDRGALRRVLVRGLDSGDREVGVFGRHGLDVIQPYALFWDSLLQLPSALISGDWAKQRLVRAVAGDLLPEWIFQRPKVRAQIGSAGDIAGILPVLVQSGHDARWLKQTFRDRFGIREDAFLNELIRAGVYRVAHEFPKDEPRSMGHVAE